MVGTSCVPPSTEDYECVGKIELTLEIFSCKVFIMKQRIRTGCTLVLGVPFYLTFADNCLAAAQGEAGRQVSFLFDKMPWMIPLAAFIGILSAGLCHRTDPYIKGNRVLRHDSAAILSHWSHAIGCVLLLVTGFGLGFFFIPRLIPGVTAAAWLMNLHFVSALLFIFGGFFWATNMVISPARLIEHLPDSNSLREMVTHYAHLFKLTKTEVRPGKYHGSERLAFVPIVLMTFVIIVSGFFKVAARVVDLPTDLMTGMTFIHDISTVIMLLLLVAHVVLGALVPWSWPLLGSMIRGHVSLDYAKKDHAAWIEQLTDEKQTKELS
jgi:formate dehydrogenase subunit gamma